MVESAPVLSGAPRLHTEIDMATAANIKFRLQQATDRVFKDATATLTIHELKKGYVIAAHATTPVALTIPDGDISIDKLPIMIANHGAQNATVVCADGFGGGGGTADTVTLATGQFALITWDHVLEQWSYLSTAAAA